MLFKWYFVLKHEHCSFRVEGLGFRVRGSGTRLQRLVYGLGFRVGCNTYCFLVGTQSYVL